jgi:hypothetical protein
VGDGAVHFLRSRIFGREAKIESHEASDSQIVIVAIIINFPEHLLYADSRPELFRGMIQGRVKLNSHNAPMISKYVATAQVADNYSVEDIKHDFSLIHRGLSIRIRYSHKGTDIIDSQSNIWIFMASRKFKSAVLSSRIYQCLNFRSLTDKLTEL